jgi:quercetin dioxygenase-like cupin family protein
MNAFRADFEELPPEKTKPHHHPGTEFLYLLSGTLRMKVASQEYELESGDSIYFDSAALHTYQRVGKKACQAVIVTVP